jgi:hypothetical protein
MRTSVFSIGGLELSGLYDSVSILLGKMFGLRPSKAYPWRHEEGICLRIFPSTTKQWLDLFLFFRLEEENTPTDIPDLADLVVATTENKAVCQSIVMIDGLSFADYGCLISSILHMLLTSASLGWYLAGPVRINSDEKEVIVQFSHKSEQPVEIKKWKVVVLKSDCRVFKAFSSGGVSETVEIVPKRSRLALGEPEMIFCVDKRYEFFPFRHKINTGYLFSNDLQDSL